MKVSFALLFHVHCGPAGTSGMQTDGAAAAEAIVGGRGGEPVWGVWLWLSGCHQEVAQHCCLLFVSQHMQSHSLIPRGKEAMSPITWKEGSQTHSISRTGDYLSVPLKISASIFLLINRRNNEYLFSIFTCFFLSFYFLSINL